MFWQKAKNLILDSVFPIYCVSCGDFLPSEKNAYLCPKCLAKIPVNSGFFCPICFKRLNQGENEAPRSSAARYQAEFFRSRIPSFAPISIGASEGLSSSPSSPRQATGYSAKENKKCSHSNRKSFLNFLGYAAYYEIPAIRDLIHNYKYRFAKSIRHTLANILIIYLKKSLNDWNDWVIIPVALHRSRFNWRGFNQSEEIAKIISQEFNWPVLNNILIRKKKTAEQAEIKGKEKRRENLRDAFKLKNPPSSALWRTMEDKPSVATAFASHSHKDTDEQNNASAVKKAMEGKPSVAKALEGKKIILLDDVYTSGATLEEAAKILKSAGAKKIIGLVIAK